MPFRRMIAPRSSATPDVRFISCGFLAECSGSEKRRPSRPLVGLSDRDARFEIRAGRPQVIAIRAGCVFLAIQTNFKSLLHARQAGMGLINRTLRGGKIRKHESRRDSTTCLTCKPIRGFRAMLFRRMIAPRSSATRDVRFISCGFLAECSGSEKRRPSRPLVGLSDRDARFEIRDGRPQVIASSSDCRFQRQSELDAFF
ncbi:hypothetical protein FF011L_16280 [Roseimaritima multifibrata]|uniref:Uncharacterized protein n=1 Tax=Roseimaritima multifibrata TaxID=1930274 RepID=A0A517MDA7_9BACT|nr:hypothetical protein FF011L_16280 [Roseimaritima multifibrata]